MSRRRLILLLLPLLSLLAGPVRAVESADAGRREVLLLNSYRQQNAWVREIVRALEDSLAGPSADITLYIENLDSKVHYDEAHYARMQALLEAKYADLDLDLLLCSDNNAFEFLRTRRAAVAGDAPLVFCGINDYRPELLEGMENLTGVAEIYSVRETVDLMLRLHPETRRLWVVNDHLTTGRRQADNIAAVLAEAHPDLELAFAPRQGIEAHRADLAALEPGTLALVGVFFADGEGLFSTFSEMGRRLAEASAVPMYCLLEMNIGHGCVGGKVVSGYEQGALMAGLARRVLDGESPDAIPVLQAEVNRYCFDHASLERWGVERLRLPPGSLVINRPVTVWSESRDLIIGGALVILFLVAVIGLLAANVSRRRASEAELRESEERLSITLDSIGDAVIVTDVVGRVMRMNPQAELLTGWKQGEAYGERLADVMRVYDSETVQPLPDLVEFVLRKGRAVEAVGRGLLVSRQGEERLIDDSGAPIFREDGTAVGVVLVFRDVTERTHLQERLLHSQKLESLGQLAGGIAHDFNNMLAGIMGYADMLADGVSSEEEMKEFAGSILTAAGRASDLTRKLLDFSRKGKVLSTPVDVHQAVREAVSLLKRSIDRRVHLEVKLEAERSSVVGDPTQIQQALLNLGINARDAMPEGGRLRLTTRNVDLHEDDAEGTPYEFMPGPYVEIAVEDTGLGIPPELMDRIFDPYFTTKPVGEGTGLGLAAVHGMVMDHKGLLRVESDPETGTAFRVCLPLADVDVSADPGAEERPRRLRDVRTVLVVDDEEMIRSMLRRMLEARGYVVREAADGMEGAAEYQLHREAIDLVLLDMVMPVMNGRDCFRALRALDPEARVVLASGFTGETAVTDLFDEGLAGFIKKPYRQNDLFRLLDEQLGPGGD